MSCFVMLAVLMPCQHHPCHIIFTQVMSCLAVYPGPMVLNVDKEGYPLQPYGVKPNRYSVLDVTDIVYVNPVNTGYSRAVDDKVKRENFFGIQADINYLAEWINTFIQRNNRWESPKYLIGESYGTIRVSGLALALQNKQWM